MIEIEELYKIYGSNPDKTLELLREGLGKEEIHEQTGQVVGVNNVSIKLKQQEIFVVMGLSGSGKSSLLRCVNRLVEPTSGKIYLDVGNGSPTEITGMEKDKLREVRQKTMSMVFQHFALLPYRTVLENTALGLKLQGQPKAKREKKAKEVVDMVGLGEWADVKPPELSGGMRQRVGLARALVTDAPVLLMDEPFSALDPLIRFDMQEELLNLQEELERTILFVTHDLGEALRVGRRVGIMNEGKIVQIGTPEQIVLNPQTEYVSRFVENADPTDVVTAGELSLKPGQMHEKEGVHTSQFSDSRELICHLNETGEPDGCEVDGRTKPIARVKTAGAESIFSPEKEGANKIFAIDTQTVLREAIKVKSASPFPLIVLTEKGKFRGIIRDREIFDGILKENSNT